MELTFIEERVYVDDEFNFYREYKIPKVGGKFRINKDKKHSYLNKIEYEKEMNKKECFCDFEKGVFYKKLKIISSTYPKVCFKGSGKDVHRILANKFIPNPEKKPFINHINGNKHDYRLENLEWCSAKENVSHAIKTGLVDRSSKRKELYIYKIDGTLICKVFGAKDASVLTGVDEKKINRIANGEKRGSKGYTFKRKEEVFAPFELKKTNRKILVVKIDGTFSKEYTSIKEAQEELGIGRNLNKVLREGRKQTCGYTAKYID